MKILRARVIEGSLAMPYLEDPIYKDLTEDNFEIICPYTTENLRKLFQLGKDAYTKGSLSKMEILAWDGGAANHDGPRFIWSYRPDKFNFNQINPRLLKEMEGFSPREMTPTEQHNYDRFWMPLQFGFSLNAWEHFPQKPSLQHRLDQLQSQKEFQQNAKDPIIPSINSQAQVR